MTKRADSETSEDMMLQASQRAQTYLTEAVLWGKEATQENVKLEPHQQRMQRAQIPSDVWFSTEHVLQPAEKAEVLRLLKSWTAGKMDDFKHVFAVLEADYDLDATYIFFGVPIRQLNLRKQKALSKVGLRFATRNLQAE